MAGDALAVGELFGSNSLAAFELHFDRFQRAFTAYHGQRMACQKARAARSAGRHTRLPDMQLLSAKPRIRAGPWLESAHTIVNRLRRLAPVDEPVFLFQQRRVGGLRG